MSTSHIRNSPPEDPKVGLYVGPRGWAFSYERGTPVGSGLGLGLGSDGGACVEMVCREELG